MFSEDGGESAGVSEFEEVAAELLGAAMLGPAVVVWTIIGISRLWHVGVTSPYVHSDWAGVEMTPVMAIGGLVCCHDDSVASRIVISGPVRGTDITEGSKYSCCVDVGVISGSIMAFESKMSWGWSVVSVDGIDLSGS